MESWCGHSGGNKKQESRQQRFKTSKHNNLPILMINPREVNCRNLNGTDSSASSAISINKICIIYLEEKGYCGGEDDDTYDAIVILLSKQQPLIEDNQVVLNACHSSTSVYQCLHIPDNKVSNI